MNILDFAIPYDDLTDQIRYYGELGCIYLAEMNLSILGIMQSLELRFLEPGS